MKYTILTTRSVMDIPYENDEQHTKECEALIAEQNQILEKEITTEQVIIHFIEDPHFINESYQYCSKEDISEYIDWLAIKDGCDLVRFENGFLGYVAYYNGHENAFEIMETELTFEEFEEVGQDMDWADYVD